MEEDFNLPSLERITQLKLLQEAIGDVPPHFWAACQVCDLKVLEQLVIIAGINPANIYVLATQTRAMSQYWGQYPPKNFSQPSTPNKPTQLGSGSSPPPISPSKKRKISDSPGDEISGSPLVYRNKQAKDKAAQRDNFCCVLTKDAITDVAHIYPFHSLKHNEEDKFGSRHMFWNLLKNFWSKEKVDAWEAEVFPNGINATGLDQPFNLITLSATAHRQWGEGLFALKPIFLSEDETTLKIQFFWQKKQDNTQATIMSLSSLPYFTKHLDMHKGDKSKTWLHYDNGQRIKSGDYFELQTDDPVQRPLPSFKLLEMQWVLQRIAGMAGAADIDWPSYSELDPYEDPYEDIYEEIPDLTLDEFGDSSLTATDPLSSPTKFVRSDNSHLSHNSKLRTEEAEGDGERPEGGDRQVDT